MTQPYSLGAHPSAPDSRDYHVAAFLPEARPPLPAKWDFTGFCQPIRNQGAEGTCVGHALASGVMGYEERTAPSVAEPYNRTLSVRDAYQGARMLEPVNGEGAQPRAAFKYAQQQGLCLEADWPYKVQSPGQAGAGAPASRAQNRIKTYSRVTLTADDLKDAMYWHGPLLAVVEVTDGFWTPDGDDKVHHRGAVAGLHAITLVGWDDGRKAFRLRNSWGTDWGHAGYCWLPYEHPIAEAWAATPDLIDGKPQAPDVPWWKAAFPFLPW